MPAVGKPDRPAPRLSPPPATLVAVPPSAGPEAAALPMAGYTIAVATDRRQHPIAGWLDQHGARTVSVQATRTVAQPYPERLAAATQETVRTVVEEVVVSSTFGLRAWFASARTLGLAEELTRRLTGARLLARDARTADGLRELGFSEIWSTASGTTEDLFSYLLAQPMSGRRVVAQLDAEPLGEFTHALMALGADVVEIPTFRMQPPTHRGVLHRLNEQIVRRQLDGLVLTSSSSVENIIEQATVDGNLDDVLNAAMEDVPFICLGPLAARPLMKRGVRPLSPTRPYPEELVSLVLRELPQRTLHVMLGGQEVQIRGHALMVGEAVVPVQAGPIAVLRALARQPGRVLSAAEIRRRTPGWSDVDDHAIEMAVSRLRRCLDGVGLDGVGLVQTVVKHGYRLAT